MARIELTIKTRDGICPASLFTPAGQPGPWPGVIFFMDGPGIRPVMWEMGQRLADGGYLVLLPDLLYRSGTYPPAKVDHLIETYAGARHGFAVPDLPSYNTAAAERHWAALMSLFDETLQRRSP